MLIRNACKKKSRKCFECCLLFAIGLGATGCGRQVALEDRTYVENIHISPTTGGYQYCCSLAYMDAQSMDALGMNAAADGSSDTESDTEAPQNNTFAMASAQSAGEDVAEEYVATAEDIEDFNQEYARITGSQLDYSHLQGIYLTESLYNAIPAEDVLEDIREETQAVLSTPIYREGVAIGDQEEVTLGEWLKKGALCSFYK